MNFLWPQHVTLEERNVTGELPCLQGVIQHCERENMVVGLCLNILSVWKRNVEQKIWL